MIIDLNRFVQHARPDWQELETLLGKMDRDAAFSLDLDGAQRFHYLYQRASADLARLSGVSSDQDIRRYLESIVARAYAEIHETRHQAGAVSIRKWVFGDFPRAFRKHLAAFWLALAIMLAGGVLGGGAIIADTGLKPYLLPFSHLMGDPSERVAMEEQKSGDSMEGRKANFSGYLMTHNIKVSIFSAGLGMTFGLGTVILLFFNGIILGAVAADYMLAGETTFLVGWLLPHGSIEIPAILIASQAGLVMAGALIGRGRPVPLRLRVRRVTADLVMLMLGVSVMLVWAGFVEAFLSQYHEPVLPYAVKIVLGLTELAFLIVFLSYAGRMRGVEQAEQRREDSISGAFHGAE